MRAKQFIVLWKDGGRIGSVDKTKENWKYLDKRFCMGLIQKDVTGTEHWNVFGVKSHVCQPD
jgi:hypothetical protein